MPDSYTTELQSSPAKTQPPHASLSPDPQVVAIGASAGGLEACTAFLDVLPHQTETAFVLVQHLDPTHASVVVELLVPHTRFQVVQATEGMLLERDHLYVIPPAFVLTVAGGALRLWPTPSQRGARLPFDTNLFHRRRDRPLRLFAARAVFGIARRTSQPGF